MQSVCSEAYKVRQAMGESIGGVEGVFKKELMGRRDGLVS